MAATDLVLAIVLAAGLGLFVYHHVVYPWLLRHFASNRQRPAPLPAGADQELPTITMLVPAYNEESHIAEKIANIAKLQYPRGRFAAIVALDGPRDLTRPRGLAAAKADAAEIDLTIVEYPKNIGKITVLNDRIAAITSDVVALSDTSAILPTDALLKAAAHFRDPEVGFVAAGYRLVAPGSEGERAYMRQLASVRRHEAILDSPLGAHGALYFFRRALFRPFPPDTINDDFILPMWIIEQGYRGVYDDSIETVELETTRRHQEFWRRVRIGAGNLQQSLWLYAGLSLSRPWILFMFASGKGARPFMPLFGFAAFVATLILVWRGSAVGAALLAAELLALTLGVYAMVRRGRPLPRAVEWIGYLVEGHAASALGAIKLLTGARVSSWQRRDGAAPAPIRIWPEKS